MKRVLSAVAVSLLLLFCASVSIANPIIGSEVAVEEPVKDVVDEAEETPSMDGWRAEHLKVKGIYVTGPTAGTEKMDEIIELINDTELNAIVLDVKDDSGNITFKMDNEDVIATGACVPYIQDIDELIKKLKDNNIYVIGRIPCFKDPILASARPQLGLVATDGAPVTDANGNQWVNPCNEEVWNYIISIVDTCCELGFDEIQLDYVRFPIGQNAENAVYGAPSDDEHRQSYISTFLKSVSDEAHKYNVPVAADVFGTIIKSTEDSKHVGQDYVTLASSLDILCPMVYPSHYASGEFGIEVPDANPYDTIHAAMMGSQNALVNLDEENSAVIRPWLQAFTASWVENYIPYGGPEIRRQIQALYDSGYEEWILWNSKSSYTADGLEPAGDN